MQRYEYKVVPAPRRGQKGKGLKGAEARFAFAIESVMNDLAAQGWEYLRTDTLPAEERSGLTGKTTAYQNMLVFRREAGTQERPAPVAVPDPAPSPAARKEPVLREVTSDDNQPDDGTEASKPD